MAIQDRSTLYLQFENNDVPTQTGFQNLIDSALNLATTSAQSIAGPLTVTELQSPIVSAGTINAMAGSFSNTVSAGNLVLTFGISAGSNINAPGVDVDTILVRPTTLSAAGTVQGTAATITGFYNLLTGIDNGVATGFVFPGNRVGRWGFLINTTSVSGNIYPPSGGTINALSTNTHFPIAANTMYTFTLAASATYFIK